MIIDTKFFDKVEIDDKKIIRFDKGLLGFDEYHKYVLLDIDDNDSLKCLQSVDCKDVAFILINPWSVVEDYKVDIDDNELCDFKDRDVNNFMVYSVVTVTTLNMTANLIGPVIINFKTFQGKQIVMYKSDYSTKHIIKCFTKKE